MVFWSFVSDLFRRKISSLKMNTLLPFSIPVKGLRQGSHQFDFQIERGFFEAFEASPVGDGNIAVHLQFDKRPALFVLEFQFSGTVKTECDRCLAKIDLPIAGQERLLVKFSEEETSEEADVVYISPDATELNVARFIYEFIVLAMPIVKTYDCSQDEHPPCDFEMLNYLEGEKKEQDAPNPIWDALKDFQADN